MELETLIGLGWSHSDDVQRVVGEALKAWQPELITLEAPVGEVVMKRIHVLGLNVKLFSTHHRPEMSSGSKKLVRVGVSDSGRPGTWTCSYTIDGEHLATLPENDAPNVALEFALTTGTPVYFVDDPFRDGLTIAGLHKGIGSTSGNVYYNILRVPPHISLLRQELLPGRADRGFASRNKFMASAILFLTERYGLHKLAHAGGMGHFRLDYCSPSATVPNFSSTTIQGMVKPGNFQLYGTSGIVKVRG